MNTNTHSYLRQSAAG